MNNITLKSRDRISGYANSFKLKSIRPLHGKYKILSVIFPNTIYNVNASNNKVLYNGTLLTLPVGFYDSTNLPSAIKKMLDDDPGPDTFTVIISSTTGKLTITSDTSTVFSLEFTNGLDKILGFDAMNNLSGAFTYTGQYIINYDINTSVGIHINESSVRNVENVTDDCFNASIFVPLSTVNFGQYVTINDENAFEQFIIFEQPTKVLNISVVSLSDQSLVDINGCEFEILIKFLG